MPEQSHDDMSGVHPWNETEKQVKVLRGNEDPILRLVAFSRSPKVLLRI